MSSFCLVFAVPDDAPALLNIYAPYVRTTAVSFECEPPTEREFAGRIASIGAFYPYLAAREGGRNGAIVGYAYASRAQERAAYRWNAELSVYLEQGRGGRGAGTALYRALLGLLALQNIRNVYGTVTLPNAASLRLHEKFGFRPVGVFPPAGYKLGRWHDVLHLDKALGDPADPPVPVRGIRELEPFAVAAALNGEAGLSGRREFCF